MILTSHTKIAIVCDWLNGVGGAELVVLELHKMFPEAPIYTSQYDPKKIDWFKDADVRTTWLNKIPNKLKKFLPVLRAISFSHLDLSEYDLVISSSGAEAKSVKTGSKTIHICYCHSPTHYYWERYNQYIKDPGFGSFNWLGRIGLKLLVGPLRKWDYKAAQNPNYLIANSNYIKDNILKYYGRDATVIFPPVEISTIAKTKNESRKGYVVTGRQTPYKRIDLAVQACTKLNIDLTVIGDGPDNLRLREMAGPTIKFLGYVSNEVKEDMLAKSVAFIFSGIDDFGISAVEALASGTPVIAYNGGGAKDYINEKTGYFFNEQTVDALCDAIMKFGQIKYDHFYIKEFSKKFSTHNFQKNIKDFIEIL